ncbi:MAG: hypothetical protein JNM39_06875 [Bdellovibrionaceae bacterium]|nr:hypothetical protein [Pseudobdellovibrionaceae bacterium]
MSHLKFCLLTLVAILVSFNSNAKVFRNAYISFEMPDTWKCVLEQTEWVCRSDPEKFQKEAKEAIIILTAKEVGPTDSLLQYEQHLNAPISTVGRNGATSISKIQYKAKQVKINDQVWIDGLHLGSEVNSYFTRYMATVKDKIAVLVTFSAHTAFYAKYSNDFHKAIMSMRVIATKNMIASSGSSGSTPGGGDPFGTGGGGEGMGPEVMPTPKGGNSLKTYLGIALLLGAIGIYLFMRSKKDE